jgi:hypothetical protein
MDTWHWQQPSGADVAAMLALTQSQYELEADTVFATDPVVYSRNLTLAVVRQFYNPNTELVQMAVQDRRLLAYFWAERGQRAVWSDDEMMVLKIVHMDLSTPARIRRDIIIDMLEYCEVWAQANGVPIICSSTMRGDQTGFLRLHREAGYDCRGSICYKRVISIGESDEETEKS